MFGGAKSVMAKDGKQSAGDRRSLPLGEKCEKKHLFHNFLMHNKFQHKLESGQKDKPKIRIPLGSLAEASDRRRRIRTQFEPSAKRGRSTRG